MNKLQQLGSGYSYYAGWDESDSTWIEKRLDDWFGKRIRTVKWNNAKIEDLTVLSQIDNLRELFITNSKISDLSPISEIESLRLIELTGSDITDLTPLQYLPNLEYLNVHRTPLTDQQVTHFANLNPGCNVLHPSSKRR
jgi:Leucine-rich repeat (LRR) protein